MNGILQKIDASLKVAGAAFFKKRHPLIAVWHLTYRCNLRCRYCGYWERKVDELNTSQALDLIQEFYQAGVRYVVLTGGEPLLREDLGDIVSACKKRGLFVSINSNGTMVGEKIASLRGVDTIKFSLDGPRDVNDRIKGAGVYDKTIEAIALCKKNGIAVHITAVISKQNINHIPDILAIAEQHGVKVCFQPASQSHCGNVGKDISPEVPDESDYNRAMTFLVEAKTKGNAFVSNSVSGLKHLSCWPKRKKISCLVNKLSFFLSPDKKIFVCDMFPGSQNHLTTVTKTLGDSFESLSLPSSCQECWVGSVVDFNLLAEFKPDCIWEACRDLAGKR